MSTVLKASDRTSSKTAATPVPAQRRRRRAWLTGYALAAPALLIMLVIFLYPLGYSFIKSFFNWDLNSPENVFVGFGNYVDEFVSTTFDQTLWNQLVFGVASLVLEVVGGMTIAVLLNSRMRGLRPARTLLLIPPMVAPAVVGLNFRWLFNEQYGLIDGVLTRLGIPAIPWLSDPAWALVSVIIASAWQNTPLLILLFLAGLQSIPHEPLEAAAVDGASGWRTFRSIILPLMRPVITIALMIRIIDLFRTFDVIWMMTQGGPGNASNLLTVEAYKLAFQSVDFGHAAAVSYVALVMSLIVLAFLYGVPWLTARRSLR